MIACKNCGRVFDGKFCDNCGQSANTKRINRQFIFEIFELGIIHLNHGFFFTLKEILVRPGITIKNYLDGKRKKYSHPLTYIAVITVIYFLLRSIFVKYPAAAGTPDSNRIIFDFIYEYYPKLVVFVFIPLAALFTPIFYQGKHYNFFELFTFHCYIRAQFMLFELLIVIINWLMIQLGATLPPSFVFITSLIFNLLFLGWAQFQFYNDKNYLMALLKAFGLMALLMLCGMLFAIIALLAMGKKG